MNETAGETKISYEQFRQEWLHDVEQADLSSLQKGRLFAAKLITQWLDVTTDDDDFFICDGSGDGGIDIAYLQRADLDSGTQEDNSEEGDTWYIVQSKHGTSFSGYATISQEGQKIIDTLLGNNQHLSSDTQQLLEKLTTFREQASDADRVVLVFATTNPISQTDRIALESVKQNAREQVFPNFDVEEVSLQTIWEWVGVEKPKLSVSVEGQFVEQSSGLLVGTVSLVDLFDFLKNYREKAGNLDQLYEKNVRQFLGSRRKINKAIQKTLIDYPDKFGLYNNGITIVVTGYNKSTSQHPASLGETVTLHDPYVVNGCQTTRTIWQVLDSKLNAGGTGQSSATENWKENVRRGGVVTKIVSSEEEVKNITRYTNYQNSVREQDFNALEDDFQRWHTQMGVDYQIFLEIQRGGIDSRKAYEKQHPEIPKYSDYVGAFDLIKVYGAGWLASPGLAFGKNAPFVAPRGSVYSRMVTRPETEVPFGTRDLYAAYQIKCAADKIGFGRNAAGPSRRLSRFLFYHIIIEMLKNVVLLTPQLQQPVPSPAVLTDAVIKLTRNEAEEQFGILRNAAIALIDQYLTGASDNSAQKEQSFQDIHDGNLNNFLKSEYLGDQSHSPLLVQLLAQHNQAFASIPMPLHEGNPTQREFVAKALLED